MPAYFLDSSALVKAYRREEGTERVTHLLNSPDALIIARLAQVEVSSALVRRGRQAGVSAVEVEAALSELDREIVELFAVIEISGNVISQALRLTKTRALRASDAIQLACALVAREQSPQDEWILVGSDGELNAAAAAEGFSVLDPIET